MHIRRVASPLTGAPFGQRRLLVEIVGAVQFVYITRNDHPLGVLPGALSNPISGVDSG